MNSNRLFTVLPSTIFLLLFLTVAPAYADRGPPQRGYTILPPQRDYTVDVGEGKFIFVMLSDPNDQSAYNQAGTVEDKTIRATYKKSGLYTAGKSPKDIWTIDWYAYGVEISADGRHLVRWGPLPTYFPVFMSYDEIALEFYEDGNLLQSYQVDNLVLQPENLPHSASHYMWFDEADFDPESKELFVKTKLGEKYLFDASTGLVIEGKLASEPSIFSERFWLLLIISVVFVALGIILFFAFRKKKSRLPH